MTEHGRIDVPPEGHPTDTSIGGNRGVDVLGQLLVAHGLNGGGRDDRDAARVGCDTVPYQCGPGSSSRVRLGGNWLVGGV